MEQENQNQEFPITIKLLKPIKMTIGNTEYQYDSLTFKEPMMLKHLKGLRISDMDLGSIAPIIATMAGIPESAAECLQMTDLNIICVKVGILDFFMPTLDLDQIGDALSGQSPITSDSAQQKSGDSQ